MTYSTDLGERSCTTQLVMLVIDLVTSVYNKKQVGLIQLDFNKASNKVSHEKFLLNTWSQRIYIKVGQQFSRQQVRSQSVLLNDSSFDAIPVTSGVPPTYYYNWHPIRYKLQSPAVCR